MGLEVTLLDYPRGRWKSIAADLAAALVLLFLSYVFNSLLPLRDAVIINAASYNAPIPPEEPGWVMAIFIWLLPLIWLTVFLLIIHRRSFKVLYGLMGWLFTMSIAIFITSIARYFHSSPRPYFANVCRPTGTSGMMLSGGLCTAPVNAKAIHSFPSGHTSLIWASWLYIGVYLGMLTDTFRRTGHQWKLAVFFMITLIAPISMMMERVSSGNHFWSDVIAGMIIGWASVAIVLFNVSNVAPQKEVDDGEEVV